MPETLKTPNMTSNANPPAATTISESTAINIATADCVAAWISDRMMRTMTIKWISQQMRRLRSKKGFSGRQECS
ncbi:hypothetical protein AciPR4_1327 [Terriglobus saanensis SP1PR4]|uniref:Uncharacterized protein n=1 Tax=Terriglobus saanensis (strain ATCC BAA-1853 / DSM 23119 / SP1PR4) TaxID=401053 RepID=E8UZZ6_TERSS|nr:hypothetical protein AciPR4_1327 [Terriglobus saanensis SP1PR4]